MPPKKGPDLGTLVKRIEKLETDNLFLKEENEALKTRVAALEKGPPIQTVVERDPTFAEIVKKNVERCVATAVQEDRAREEKKTNIVVSGTRVVSLPPGEDEATFRKIAEALDVSLDGVRFVTGRVGKEKKKVVVKISNPEVRREMLRKARHLKDVPEEVMGRVYLAPDRTREEQKQDYELRCELRKRRQEAKDRGSQSRYFLRRGKIVEENGKEAAEAADAGEQAAADGGTTPDVENQVDGPPTRTIGGPGNGK